MQHHDLSEPSKNCGRNGSHSAWWTGWRYHHRRVYKPSLLAIKELQSEIWRKAFEAVHKCFGLSVTLFVRHGNAGVRGLSPKHVQAVFVGIDLQDTCKKQRFPISKAYCCWNKWTWCQRLFAKHTNAAISGKADIRRVDCWWDTRSVSKHQNVDAPVEDEFDIACGAPKCFCCEGISGKWFLGP